MENQLMYALKLTATFSVLVPMAVGLLNFRKLDLHVKLFLLFLLVGLLVDLAGWYFYVTRNDGANLFARHFYDLFETLFLFWFLSRVSPDKLMSRFLGKAWLLVVPFWLIRFSYLESMAIFRTSTEVCIAFATCFIILRMVEVHQQATRQVVFWILLGVFFYCFSTYFIMGMLATRLSRLWYTHNLVNIVTNVIYLVGFSRVYFLQKISRPNSV